MKLTTILRTRTTYFKFSARNFAVAFVVKPVNAHKYGGYLLSVLCGLELRRRVRTRQVKDDGYPWFGDWRFLRERRETTLCIYTIYQELSIKSSLNDKICPTKETHSEAPTVQRLSNSGLTQLGCPLLARIEGPNFCRRKMIGTVAKKVMMPWAAKHHVHPDAACHGEMKNYQSEG